MSAQTIQIDLQGRIELPRVMREALGLIPQTEALVELTAKGIFIRPKHSATPITQRIANMNLPVSDWAQMEKEIEAEHI